MEIGTEMDRLDEKYERCFTESKQRILDSIYKEIVFLEDQNLSINTGEPLDSFLLVGVIAEIDLQVQSSIEHSSDRKYWRRRLKKIISINKSLSKKERDLKIMKND